MAIIPRFDERIGQSLRSDVAAPNVRSYTMPARSNELEDLGATISQVAALYKQNMEREAANYASQASSTLYESSVSKMAEAKERALATGNITGFADSLVSEYQEDAEELIANAPNPIARNLIENRVRQTAAALGAEAMKFEATEKVRMYKTSLNVAADKYAKAATIDPSQIPEIFKQLEGDLYGARATLGINDTEILEKTYKNNIVSRAISRALISQNINEASNLLARYQEDLSAGDYLSFANNIDKAKQRLLLEAQALDYKETEVSRAWAAMNGGLPLDPSNRKDKEALEYLYLNAREKDPNLDFTDVAIKARIMPSTMRNDLYSRLSGGESMQKVMAASMINKINSAAPELLKGLDAKSKAKASLIAKFTEAGIDPKRATEWAETQTSPAMESVIKQRTKDVTSGRVNLSFDNVKSKFTGFLGFGVSESAIPYQMKGEYTELAKAYYIDVGLSPKEAREAALNDIKSNWTVTNVFGNQRYMKHAPEIEYANGAGSAWIYDQFKEVFLNIPLLEGAKATEADLKNIVIDVDPQFSYRIEGEDFGKPLYNFYRIDLKRGIFDIILGEDGTPLRYKPDFYSSKAYKEALDEAGAITGQHESWEAKINAYEQYTKEQRAKAIARDQEPYFGNILGRLVKEAKKGDSL